MVTTPGKFIFSFDQVPKDRYNEPTRVLTQERMESLIFSICRNLDWYRRNKYISMKVNCIWSNHVRRVVRVISQWFNMWAAQEDHITLTSRTFARDRYGYDRANLILDFKDFDHFFHNTGFSGRTVIEIFARFEPELIASKFKRWLFEKCPKLINPLRQRFVTNVNVVMRIWVDENRHYDVTIYRFKASEGIIPVREDSETEYRKKIIYERRKELFQARKGVSKF